MLSLITYWDEGYFREIIGVVDKVDLQAKRIKLNIDDDSKYISIYCLKEVERYL